MLRLGNCSGLGFISLTGILMHVFSMWLSAFPPLTFQSPMPDDVPLLERGSIAVGAIERTYGFYVPAELGSDPALVFVFHGAGGDAERIRLISGYQWERLADTHHFVVVYPEGFEKHWNGCRKSAPYAAKQANVDDTGFVRALVAHFREAYDIEPDRVFAAGLSNGGHMVYRLALETPELWTAVAAIGANLPAPENFRCNPTNRPVAVMMLNGTEDPVNPFYGGSVVLPDKTSFGAVRSASETARYFGRIAGHRGPPETTLFPERDGWEVTRVEQISWHDPALPEVSLYKIYGGGHSIPQHRFRAPEQYGRTVAEINGPEEIWKFFQRQMERVVEPLSL